MNAEFLVVRTDWHVLFDDSQWLLVPEVKIIEDLKKMYLTDGYPTSNLPEVLSYFVGRGAR